MNEYIIDLSINYNNQDKSGVVNFTVYKSGIMIFKDTVKHLNTTSQRCELHSFLDSLNYCNINLDKESNFIFKTKSNYLVSSYKKVLIWKKNQYSKLCNVDLLDLISEVKTDNVQVVIKNSKPWVKKKASMRTFNKDLPIYNELLKRYSK